MQGKHKGNRSIYTDQRDKELLVSFRRAKSLLLKQKGYVLLNEALDIARSSPCSRYFVSEQRASCIIRKLCLFDDYISSLSTGNPLPKPEDPLENMIYMRRRLFSHLFIVYKNLRKQEPDATHEELVTMACATKADEFYLTIASTREILSRIINNARKNNGYTSNRNLLDD